MTDDSLAPSDPADIEPLIDAAIKEDQSAFAVVLLRTYLASHPQSNVARYQYAENLRAIGALDEAAAVLRLIEMNTIPEARRYLVELSLAQISEDKGNWSEANQHFIAATTLRPDLTVPWVFYGGFLSRQGKVTEATSILRRGLEASGDIDEVYLNLGNCARAIGDYAAAHAHYVSALVISPEYAEAKAALKDVEAAIEFLSRIENADANRAGGLAVAKDNETGTENETGTGVIDK